MQSYVKDYPRPQLVRKKWENLNGEWDFIFDDKKEGELKKWYQEFPEQSDVIQVPFTYETKLSGIQREEHHEQIWYHRVITLNKRAAGERVLLHFEGSDYITQVWVNGEQVGSHQGGYARFSFDITHVVLEGANEITVKVTDSMDMEQPRGKQRWMKDNFGCWYIQTTGIWKTVWLETVPETYLEQFKLTPDIQKNEIEINYQVHTEHLEQQYSIEAEISFHDQLIAKSSKQICRNEVQDVISVFSPEEFEWGIHMWSPEHPDLYDMKFTIMQAGKVVDEVYSYFAMREIRIDKGNILLNGSPLYQRLILDQGYWKDSHLTPPNEEALIEDIDKIHELGYNGLRKHMKVEDERFLYWCDVKGMLVWSEMAAAYHFNDQAVENFTREWMEVVRQNYNHPCIITWTPFNESWGVPQIEVDRKQQQFTESIYHLTKSFDQMRPVIVNDGWEHTVSDIITLHDYEEDGDVFFDRYAEHLEEIVSTKLYHSRNKSAMANGYEYKGQPIIISEYGGIAFSGGEEGTWGYGNVVSSEADFLKRFDKITTAIKEIPYIVGFCYTQVSDVQQEINGLMDIERNYKISPEKIQEINCREVGIHPIHVE